jgi:hypothetical protein
MLYLDADIMLLYKPETFNGIHKFDTTLLQWSKIAYGRFGVLSGKLASLGGKVLVCGSGKGEMLLNQRGCFSDLNQLQCYH